MTIALFLVSGILTVFFVISPLLRFQSYCDAKSFEQSYKAFKLRTVQRHYPFLRDLPRWEIEKTYDLDLLYENIR